MAEHPDLLILGFPEYTDQTSRLARELDCRCELVDIHHFPDGESRVRLPIELPGHVAFCRSLNQPHGKLIELMLAARTARDLGAHRVTLVAPYLCYMRQDTAFSPGEAVSQRIVGAWLAELFDRVITVDPHLHRTATLSEALPETQAVALSATPLMAEYVRGLPEAPVLVAPDGEAKQWVARIAGLSGADFTVATKQRSGDRDVDVRLADSKLEGRVAVLVDDIVSTGETMAAAVELANAGGASEVHCLVTHPLFCAGALERLREAGAHRIVSSDSISHETNRLRLAPLIAPAVT